MGKVIVLALLVGLVGGVEGGEGCKKLVVKVKGASEFVLGIDYPWWYNLGQIETESNCMWRTSLDGWGSVGYAQLTYKFLKPILDKFPQWNVKDATDHFLAQAYVVKDCIRQASCSRLWNAYQCYNRSCWKVNREAREGGCEWEKAFDICSRRYAESVCVWRVDGQCRQWRTNCDVNYCYGYKVWRNGKKYNPGVIENVWRYW